MGFFRRNQNVDLGQNPDIDRGPGLRSIFTINLSLLYAFVLGACAWFLWPETKECWRFGVLSVFFGLGAFALAFKSMGDIWRHIARDRDAKKFERGKRKPQSDGVVGDEAMRRSGMIE